MRISDWSSDVCSSDLRRFHAFVKFIAFLRDRRRACELSGPRACPAARTGEESRFRKTRPGVETASRTRRPGPRCGGMREEGEGKAVLDAAALKHAGLERGRFRHHVAAHRWVEAQPDVGPG